MAIFRTSQVHEPWIKGKLIGQKASLKLKDIWAIRIRLQLGNKVRDLALFSLALDSKLCDCDLVKLRVAQAKPVADIEAITGDSEDFQLVAKAARECFEKNEPE
ncbi:hypothetical protein [Stenotrophomonas sp. Y-13]|uniref:hypothetical protein n=1 Tax=Stenotrophomonas sp. Y-13 TaxID=3384161 RepID=UPI003916E947